MSTPHWSDLSEYEFRVGRLCPRVSIFIDDKVLEGPGELVWSGSNGVRIKGFSNTRFDISASNHFRGSVRALGKYGAKYEVESAGIILQDSGSHTHFEIRSGSMTEIDLPDLYSEPSVSISLLLEVSRKYFGLSTLSDYIMEDGSRYYRTSERAALYKELRGIKLSGDFIDDNHLQLTVTFPIHWTESKLIAYAEGLTKALEILTGASHHQLRTSLKLPEKPERIFYRARVKSQDLESLNLFPDAEYLKQSHILQLSAFLARPTKESKTVRALTAQLFAAAEFESSNAQELFIGASLEGLVRSLLDLPFGSGRLNMRKRLGQVCETYKINLTADQLEAVLQAYWNLRDRNAHPYWLAQDRAELERVNEMYRLMAFYGYAIRRISKMQAQLVLRDYSGPDGRLPVMNQIFYLA